MAASLKIEVPPGAAAWSKGLAKSITESLNAIRNEIKNEIAETREKIEDRFDQLSQQLVTDVRNASKLANDALDLATRNEHAILAIKQTQQEHEQSIKELKEAHAQATKLHKQEMFSLTVKYDGVKNDNIKLQRQQEKQESYSRRDNLIIRGIKENDNETEDACMKLVRNFFVEQLCVPEAEAASMVFVRCHRVGKKTYNKRPIVVRFQHFADRKLIWGKRFQLKDKLLTMHENYASDVEYRRRMMYPILAAAKKSGKYVKAAYLNADVLRINGKDYTIENLHELPQDLHPCQFSCKENEQWLIFGGIHSQYNFLSNYYPSRLTHMDITFDSVEHAYQYQKAIRYNDIDSSKNILCCSTPSEAKRIGYHIKNFRSKDWDSVKEDLMQDLLKIKFAQRSQLGDKLAATDGKSLAEAGQSDSFAIGMPLNHRDIFDTTKWKKNLLGKMLMNIRQELLI